MPDPPRLYPYAVRGQKLETLREAVLAARQSGEMWKRIAPPNAARKVQQFLRAKGLSLYVWYRKSHPIGYMVDTVPPDETGRTPCMQRIGRDFAAAAEMARSDTLDFLYGEPPDA